MHNCRAFLCCMLLAAPLSAHAGLYAGPALMVGITQTDNEEETSTGLATNIHNRTDTLGATVGVSGLIGYDFNEDGLPWSLELSGNWRARHDQFLTYDVSGISFYGTKANIQTYDFIVSALYDLPLGTEIQPYIGAGAGLTYAYLTNEYIATPIVDTGDTSTTNFTWQLQGGIKYPIDDGMKLRVDYRYVDAGEIETSATPTGEKFTSDLSSHDMRVGVTWDF